MGGRGAVIASIRERAIRRHPLESDRAYDGKPADQPSGESVAGAPEHRPEINRRENARIEQRQFEIGVVHFWRKRASKKPPASTAADPPVDSFWQRGDAGRRSGSGQEWCRVRLLELTAARQR